jgi:predicted transcriptional regulator YdeE
MYNCRDSYVIRVYRREETDTRQMVGLVETVGNEEQKPFATIEELWKILSAEQKPRKSGQATSKRRIRENRT